MAVRGATGRGNPPSRNLCDPPVSQPVTRDRPEDDGQDGHDDGREERDPERAAEQEFADVGLADRDSAEGGLSPVYVLASAASSIREAEKTHSFGETHEDEQGVEVVRVRDEVDDREREREDDLCSST